MMAMWYASNCSGTIVINNKGYSLLKTGHGREARDHVMQALALDKGNARAYRHLALICIEENNKAEALAAVDKALFYRYRENYGDDIDEVIANVNAL